MEGKPHGTPRVKAPSGYAFGTILGSENKAGERREMRQRMVGASQRLQGKYQPDPAHVQGPNSDTPVPWHLDTPVP